jgi:hypothetical protein
MSADNIRLSFGVGWGIWCTLLVLAYVCHRFLNSALAGIVVLVAIVFVIIFINELWDSNG